jgi:3-oxoacyl-[acyl-carrier protein] reductase
MIGIENKVALVTGAGAGIGYAIAESFARLGAHVIIADIDPVRVDLVCQKIQEAGLRAAGMVIDVADISQVSNAIRQIDDQFGKIHILVNNVGGELKLRKPFAETTADDWDKLYAINLRHVFIVTHAAIPLLRRAGSGAIINISTIEAFRGIPYSAVYSAFKTAISGFTRSLALELAPDGIRVNAIAPETTESSSVDISSRIEPEHMGQIKNWIPVGRFGQASDIAGSAVFLASDLSQWVTGTTIHVDGGALAAAGWVRMPDGGWTHRPIVSGSGYRHHREVVS